MKDLHSPDSLENFSGGERRGAVAWKTGTMLRQPLETVWLLWLKRRDLSWGEWGLVVLELPGGSLGWSWLLWNPPESLPAPPRCREDISSSCWSRRTPWEWIATVRWSESAGSMLASSYCHNRTRIWTQMHNTKIWGSKEQSLITKYKWKSLQRRQNFIRNKRIT